MASIGRCEKMADYGKLEEEVLRNGKKWEKRHIYLQKGKSEKLNARARHMGTLNGGRRNMGYTVQRKEYMPDGKAGEGLYTSAIEEGDDSQRERRDRNMGNTKGRVRA